MYKNLTRFAPQNNSLSLHMSQSHRPSVAGFLGVLKLLLDIDDTALILNAFIIIYNNIDVHYAH